MDRYTFWRCRTIRFVSDALLQVALALLFSGVLHAPLPAAEIYFPPSETNGDWVAAEWNALPGPIAVHSCTKSLTALAMAKLFDLSDAGKLAKTIGPESFAHEYLPASWGDSDPRKKLIRVKHLLTMSSGLQPRDGGGTDGLPRWEFVLTRPVEAAPETVWAYSFGADLLSLIIENVSGQTLQEFFNQHVNAPIGISPVEWSSPDGHSSGSGGAR